IHKYHWIQLRSPFLEPNEDVLYITNARYYKSPTDAFAGQFESILPIDTIPIFRDAEVVNYFFVYKLKNYIPTVYSKVCK
ncbi:MAG: hypothetical protein N2517_05775, partial [Ignavibacteria bacterium]|nr:hypothetical protein [Ignavibacteria bacterium]